MTTIDIHNLGYNLLVERSIIEQDQHVFPDRKMAIDYLMTVLAVDGFLPQKEYDIYFKISEDKQHIDEQYYGNETLFVEWINKYVVEKKNKKLEYLLEPIMPYNEFDLTDAQLEYNQQCRQAIELYEEGLQMQYIKQRSIRKMKQERSFIKQERK
jgi:hypothetical protein